MTSPELSPSGLTSVFFAVHLAGGHIGVPILVLTFLFSKTAKRHPTIVNFCATWIIYSIIYCILIYGGESLLENPPYDLCLTQASMIYAAPPMAVVAGLEVVLHIWSTFMLGPCQLDGPFGRVPHWLKTLAIISPPYLTFVAFAIGAAHVGHQNPQWVGVKHGLYCGLAYGKFEMLAVPIFCSILLICIMVFEVASILKYFSGRRVIYRDFPLVSTAKTPSLSPWCRAALFLVYSALTLAACIMDMRPDPHPFTYMIQASLPLAAFLIFGLQKDVALAWFFWKSRPKWDPEEKGKSSDDAHRVNRPLSAISGMTVESTTPIATHYPASIV